jgi:hypothetical protein
LLGYCASAGVVSEASAAIPPAARKPVRRIMLSPQGPPTDHER